VYRMRLCVYVYIALWFLRPAAGSRRSIRSRNFRFSGGEWRECESVSEKEIASEVFSILYHWNIVAYEQYSSCKGIEQQARGSCCSLFFWSTMSNLTCERRTWLVGVVGRGRAGGRSGRSRRPGDAGPSVMDGFHWGRIRNRDKLTSLPGAITLLGGVRLEMSA